MLPPRLEYLFTARFQDGSVYFQHPSDSSQVHPMTRSSFWDVSQKLEQVKEFTLRDRRGHHEHTVFLGDGHFQTDGQVLPCPRPDLNNFRLIYFRRVEQTLESNPVEGEQHHARPKVIGYFMGWQANDATGKNYQMLLEIPPPGLGTVKINQKQ